MLKPAQQYLTLRSLGAPAVLLSLAMQGVFRGFKDTKTPLYAIGMLHIVATFPFISPLGTLVQCVLNSCISVSDASTSIIRKIYPPYYELISYSF